MVAMPGCHPRLAGKFARNDADNYAHAHSVIFSQDSCLEDGAQGCQHVLALARTPVVVVVVVVGRPRPRDVVVVATVTVLQPSAPCVRTLGFQCMSMHTDSASNQIAIEEEFCTSHTKHITSRTGCGSHHT